MTKSALMRKSIVAVLACILLLCAFVPAVCGGAAYAEEAVVEATTAAVYGNINTDDLWYFGGDELNISALRAYAGTQILPVLEANSAEPVVIAVVDTGIDLNNSLFSGMILTDDTGKIMGYNSYYDSVNDSSKLGDVTDETSDKHGTAVASVIAILARELGLQDYVKIYPIKASYSSNSGKSNKFNIDTIRLAIQNAVSDEVGADVINLSLCSESPAEWANDTLLKNVIADAATEATIVAAAGNDGRSSDTTRYYPAAYDGVVGVMASAAGGEAYSSTNYGSAYDVFAPGENILVSKSDASGEYVSGTSMAAPIVSFAAALLKLSLTAEQLAGGMTPPRNTVVTRLVTHVFDDDAVIKAGSGEYKKLDILKLVSEDIFNMDDAWLDVTGINVTAKRNGSTVATDGSMTVQTLRETGKGRSYLEFTASLTPVGDTDPTLESAIVWELVEYTENASGEETEASVTEIGKGASCGYLFDRGGSFGVRASLTTGEGATAKTFTAEFRTEVSWAAWNGANAFIVTEDYLTSDAYINGTGGSIAGNTVLYGSGNSVTLAVTTLEDVEYEAVNWYVNGEIAWTGEKFVFSPSGAPGKDYTVTVQVVLSDSDKPYVRNAFTVEHKSWAAHPLFAILWTALGVGVIAGGVFVGMKVRKKKAAASVAEAERDDAEEKPSPIRKK